MRPVPFQTPLSTPYFRMAPIMYRLQLGSKRQTGPIKGLRVT